MSMDMPFSHVFVLYIDLLVPWFPPNMTFYVGYMLLLPRQRSLKFESYQWSYNNVMHVYIAGYMTFYVSYIWSDN